MQKFLLIGLGNPGEKYAVTRHNAGKMFSKWLQKNQPQKEYPFEAIGTESFMNNSGEWIYNTYKNYNRYKDYSRLLIAHDDLDLSLGSFKIQFGRGPHDHKGLLSIYQFLGTKNFWHVRIGIDNRCGSVIASSSVSLRGVNLRTTWQSAAETDSHGLRPRNDSQHRESGESYTLKPFKKEEKEILAKVFAKIRIDLIDLISN